MVLVLFLFYSCYLFLGALAVYFLGGRGLGVYIIPIAIISKFTVEYLISLSLAEVCGRPVVYWRFLAAFMTSLSVVAALF